jgi:hypothetical protein
MLREGLAVAVFKAWQGLAEPGRDPVSRDGKIEA